MTTIIHFGAFMVFGRIGYWRLQNPPLCMQLVAIIIIIPLPRSLAVVTMVTALLSMLWVTVANLCGRISSVLWDAGYNQGHFMRRKLTSSTARCRVVGVCQCTTVTVFINQVRTCTCLIFSHEGSVRYLAIYVATCMAGITKFNIKCTRKQCN